ncbi:hypothetical protein BFJ63_vAg19146 [Fusarium oxysporum f. sp. narcissi]|uniref:Uncharacterized protein n=1 Tax=Fusarium oxysporum f. sp. narcissi TaxID=451672 RepID=A0A4Q2UUN6_FUSOX|nr:hypothetical protein BFJ63_vAg19146 [Fusarium oxysporum f. sp. narcissi]
MCYLRLLSTSTFRLREPATFRPLRPSTSRTTDFCSPGCPDHIRGILPLDIEGRRTLTLTLTCSFALPRPTSAAFAARTTQTAFGCSTFRALWCPRP